MGVEPTTTRLNAMKCVQISWTQASGALPIELHSLYAHLSAFEKSAQMSTNMNSDSGRTCTCISGVEGDE